MKTILLSVLLFGLTGSFATNEQCLPGAQKPQDDENVTDLILAIDEATTPSERQDLANRLIAIGPKALPAIKKAPDGLSRQTEIMLERILNEIEKNSNAKKTESSRFSLTGEFSVDEALASIKSQTGVSFHSPPDSSLKPKFDLKDVEFWIGMDQVLDAFEFDLGMYTEPGQLDLSRAEKNRKRIQNVGYSQLIRAEAISYSSGINFRQQKTHDKLKVEVRWEPTLMPTQILLDHNDVEIIGPNRKIYKSTKADRTTYHVLKDQTHILVDLEFDRLPRKSDLIESINAKLLMTAPVGRKDFEFDDVLNGKNKSVRHADMKVTLQSATLDDENRLKVNMTFQLDNAGDSLESHRGWMFHNVAQLIDKKGKRIESKRWVTTTQKKDKMGFTYFFDVPDGPAGCKFVYQSPTSIQSIPIKLEIKNIELE